jgi:hypothetical protein
MTIPPDDRVLIGEKQNTYLEKFIIPFLSVSLSKFPYFVNKVKNITTIIEVMV